jgi:hypothetical protein
VEHRASLLHAPIMAASDDLPAVNEDCAYRNPTFSSSALCFFNRYIEV